MKWIIRIICFALTTAIYIPIETALHNAGISKLLIGLVTVVIYFFIYLIPSRAIIAMREKHARVVRLNNEIFACTISFMTKSGVRPELVSVVTIWTAFFYSVWQIIDYKQIRNDVHKQFVSYLTEQMKFNMDQATTRDIIQYQTIFLDGLPSNPTTPLTPDVIQELLSLTMKCCITDRLEVSNRYQDTKDLLNFTNLILHLSTFTATLFPAQNRTIR